MELGQTGGRRLALRRQWRTSARKSLSLRIGRGTARRAGPGTSVTVPPRRCTSRTDPVVVSIGASAAAMQSTTSALAPCTCRDAGVIDDPHHPITSVVRSISCASRTAPATARIDLRSSMLVLRMRLNASDSRRPWTSISTPLARSTSLRVSSASLRSPTFSLQVVNSAKRARAELDHRQQLGSRKGLTR